MANSGDGLKRNYVLMNDFVVLTRMAWKSTINWRKDSLGQVDEDEL